MAIGKHVYYSTRRWAHIVSLQPGLLMVLAPLVIVTPYPDTPAVGPDTPDMEFLVHVIFVL